MHLDQIPPGSRTEYEADCNLCGMPMKVLTQNSNNSEYETEIYVQCQCGEYVEFILPVN